MVRDAVEYRWIYACVIAVMRKNNISCTTLNYTNKERFVDFKSL